MVAAHATPGKRRDRTLTAVTRTARAPLPVRWNPLRAASKVLFALPAVVLALAVACALAAPPAAADGAGPTNFESVVDDVAPDRPDLTVDVVGGDAFLRVRARPGTEVRIPGYDGEPYLRIEADGTVLRNARSSATYLNRRRDGTAADLPAGVGSRAEPRWERIGDGGEVAWHDHRIHWMVSQPPEVGKDRVVQSWSVPMVVDGSEVEVSGHLLLHDDALPWAALVTLAALAVSLVLAGRVAWRVPLLAGASAVALYLGIASHVVNPPDAGASVLPIALPLVALAASLGSLVAPASLRLLVLPLASVAALAGWGAARLGVLWMPVVPTSAPSWADRAGTGLVLGVAVGVAVAVLVRPVPDPEPGSDGGTVASAVDG